MKYSVRQKQIEQRSLRTRASRTNLFRTFRPAAFVATLFVFIGLVSSQGYAQTDGIMVLQNLTTPRGGVWLNNATPATPPGGHYWETDGVLGICRVDPLPGGNPPWQMTNCQVTAKTASQPVIATPAATIKGLPAGAQFVFVADASSKTITVVRYVFDPSTERLSANLTITVQNPTSVGGRRRRRTPRRACHGTEWDRLVRRLPEIRRHHEGPECNFDHQRFAAGDKDRDHQ